MAVKLISNQEYSCDNEKFLLSDGALNDYRLDTLKSNTVNSKLRLNLNFLPIQFPTFLSYYIKIALLIRIPLFRRKYLADE